MLLTVPNIAFLNCGPDLNPAHMVLLSRMTKLHTLTLAIDVPSTADALGNALAQLPLLTDLYVFGHREFTTMLPGLKLPSLTRLKTTFFTWSTEAFELPQLET